MPYFGRLLINHFFIITHKLFSISVVCHCSLRAFSLSEEDNNQRCLGRGGEKDQRQDFNSSAHSVHSKV